MAARGISDIELVNNKPVTKQPKKKTDTVTWWELIERAIKEIHRRSHVAVLRTPYARGELHKFIDCFDVAVDRKDGKPREVQRTIVDITVKDYTNEGDKNQDETVVKIMKSTSSKEGTKYNLINTTGVEWGVEGNIGLNKIISAGLGGKYTRKKETTEVKEDSIENELKFEYHHEEKLQIPPGKKIQVRLTTSSVRYQQNYTLRYTASKSDTLRVLYRSNDCFGLQSCFCGASSCYITARDLMKYLPDFQETDDEVSYTQDGTLEWVGEGCDVEKIEGDA